MQVKTVKHRTSPKKRAMFSQKGADFIFNVKVPSEKISDYKKIPKDLYMPLIKQLSKIIPSSIKVEIIAPKEVSWLGFSHLTIILKKVDLLPFSDEKKDRFIDEILDLLDDYVF